MEASKVEEWRLDQLIDMMKNMRPIAANIHTVWKEYLKIGSNFSSLFSLLIDENPSNMMKNKLIEVVNIEIILVVLYNSVASTTHKSVIKSVD